MERKVLETVSLAQSGQSTGPITLKHRKLTLKEITEHLDMDEETATLHLRTTNIHGYYSLTAKNYPPGTEFILYQIDMAGKVNATKNFFVNGNGSLMTRLDDLYIELPNNFLFFTRYLPGEPSDFVLGSQDGKYFAATRIVPNPIEVIGRNHQRVSVQIASPDKRRYRVHCSGFQPHGNYMLVSRFENEKLVHALQANANGEMFQSIGPTIPWITGGDASIEVRGEGIERPITLEYQWGL